MPELVATKGHAGANSYATTDEADTLLGSVYGADEWDLLEQEDKEKLLLTATTVIDCMPMRYQPATSTQALCFPVENLADPTDDGFTAAKAAAVWQAYHLLLHGEALKEALSVSILGVKSESASSASRSFAGFNTFRRYHPMTLGKLSSFLKFEFKIRRG